VAIVSVTAVAVVLFAVPLAFALSDLYREEEVVRLERSAAEVSEHIPSSFPTAADPVELPQKGDKQVALYNRTGSRVTGVGPVAGDVVVRAALRGDVRDAQIGDQLVVGAPVTRGERVVGALRIEAPVSTVTRRTWHAILLMAGIGALVIGISAAIATWQARRLTRPVDQLARDAVRLGDGDFTVATDPSGVPEIDAVSEALSATAARLDQMLTRERTFSEDASHQLRTPLTGLRVTLEAARLDPSADRDISLDTALGQIDRLEQTIDDLLALAREVPTDRPALDLGPELATLEDDWHGRLAAEARPLQVITDPDLPRVNVSDRALRQVLDVLVDNAWHHGSGAITVHARRSPAGAVIEVTDEGAGVRGDIDAIFERRAPGANRHGIGLALARSLAEADGLRLNLVERGPHPVFAIFLPTRSESPTSGSPA
jgi:signal transduction histidine kinase